MGNLSWGPNKNFQRPRRDFLKFVRNSAADLGGGTGLLLSSLTIIYQGSRECIIHQGFF